MPFKDTKEGQTHHENDGCGEPKHNMSPENKTIEEIVEEWTPVLTQAHEYQLKAGFPSSLEELKHALKITLKKKEQEGHERGSKETSVIIDEYHQGISSISRALRDQGFERTADLIDRDLETLSSHLKQHNK